MSDMSDKKWRELTFSQREGKAPLPEALQIGQLSKAFRNEVWRVLYISIEDSIRKYNPEKYCFTEPKGYYWIDLVNSYYFNVLGTPYDEIQDDAASVMKWLKLVVLKGEYHEVLTLLEHMFRCGGITDYLADSINECMELAPYCIDRLAKPICIVPTTSEAMKKAVTRSLENINKSELDGAKSHLSKAAPALNKNDYATSVRESISAVESAVRRIDHKSSKRFSSALDSLEEKGMIKHPALKAAFNKLYGYTSDAEGLRHPLISKDAADVEFEEAMFMYTACVAFVDFLISKQRRMKEK